MKTIKATFALCLLLLLPIKPAAAGLSFDLRLDRLAEAIGLLPENDRAAVEEVISLIKKGDNKDALDRLNALNQTNPANSSLRVLTSYTLLQIGNAIGALEEADKAHESPNGDAYKCLFYAKIAFLTGNAEKCKRELTHARKFKYVQNEVKALESDIKKSK